MSAHQIIADENIPHVSDLFSDLGDIEYLPGRAIVPERLRFANILLVRSVTPVNKTLLQGSNVRFVASATAGTDHVNRDWLKKAGIGFSHAPGSNAISVLEYVLSAINQASLHARKDWRFARIGIIGRGEVGRRLHDRLKAIGITCMIVDPYAPARDGSDVSLSYLLRHADIVTLHTPLTKSGMFPTLGMIGSNELKVMKQDALLINTSRGAVLDNKALLAHLNKNPDFMAVLDVWENEPTPNPELIKKTFIATGHIAGYSREGKIRGSQQAYEAICEYLGRPADKYIPSPPPVRLSSEAFWQNDMDDLLQAQYLINKVCNLRHDSRLFKELMLDGPKESRGYRFDQYRKQYQHRREFSSVILEMNILRERNINIPKLLSGIGFNCLGINTNEE